MGATLESTEQVGHSPLTKAACAVATASFVSSLQSKSAISYATTNVKAGVLAVVVLAPLTVTVLVEVRVTVVVEFALDLTQQN